MALISSSTVIRTLSLFHLTLAFFFLTNPRVIADQNLVFILGQAMHMPHSSAFDKPSHTTAFLAVLLAFQGISDLATVSLPEEISRIHWSAQAPIRLLFLFALTGYTFLFAHGGRSSIGSAGAGGHLKNSVVFTWSFLELAAWFWIFTLLREERKQGTQKLMEKRRAEEDGI